MMLILALLAASSFDHPAAVELHMGVGTPYGLIGVSGEYAPISWLVLAGGAGTNVQGLQLALAPRLRFVINEEIAFDAGAGVSTGPYCARDLFCGALGDGVCRGQRRSKHTVWSNYELSFEVRLPIGVQLRPYAGLALNMNPQSLVCSDMHGCEGTPDYGRWLLFAGGALGYVF